jgi:hypothetical protein
MTLRIGQNNYNPHNETLNNQTHHTDIQQDDIKHIVT